MTDCLSVELDGGFGSPSLAFADGTGVVLGGYRGVDGCCLGVAGVYPVDKGADYAGGGIAEDGDKGDLWRKDGDV